MLQSIRTAVQKNRNHSKQQVDKEIKRAIASMRNDQRRLTVFFEMLAAVQAKSRLLHVAIERGERWDQACQFVLGLANLSRFFTAHLRHVSTWQPPQGSPRLVFADLWRHLLGEYPTPYFFSKTWLLRVGPGDGVLRQQVWAIYVCRGRRFRSLQIPLPYTRRMEHHFLQAPDHYSIFQAMRYGQVRGMGGRTQLAQAVVATRLGNNMENPDFWQTVLEFFVRTPDLDTNDVGPIVDYLQQIKFGGQDADDARPPRPDYAIKGQTYASIKRQMLQWHTYLGYGWVRHNYTWPRSSLRGFTWSEDNQNPEDPTASGWSITELLSYADLKVEGRFMHHCVATYAPLCRRGQTTIWSLQRLYQKKRKRRLTIQVDPISKTIVQAKGRLNRRPDSRSQGVMEMWARQQGLRMGRVL